MDEAGKRQNPAAFLANTEGNGARQESPEEESSSAATPITVEVRRNSGDSRKMECALPAQRLTQLIEEFMSGIAPEAHVPAGQPGSQHMSSMVEEITSDGLVRLALKKHLSHIDRLEEIEKQSKEPQNDWARNIQVLTSVAAILLKIEAAQKLFDAQVQARCPIPEPQLSEEAQDIAKLTKVDQNLIREAGEKFKIFLKRSIEEGAESDC
jgi:hypothetical protein